MPGVMTDAPASPAAEPEAAPSPAPLPFVIPRAHEDRMVLFSKDGSRHGDAALSKADVEGAVGKIPVPAPDEWLGISYYVKIGTQKFPPKAAAAALFDLDLATVRLPLGGHVAAAFRELGFEAGRRGIPFRPRKVKETKVEAPADDGDDSSE